MNTTMTSFKKYWMVALPLLSMVGIALEAIYSRPLLQHIEHGLPYSFQVEYSVRAVAFILIVLTGIAPILLALDKAPDAQSWEIVQYELAVAAVVAGAVGMVQLFRNPVGTGLLQHGAQPYLGYACTVAILLSLRERRPMREKGAS